MVEEAACEESSGKVQTKPERTGLESEELAGLEGVTVEVVEFVATHVVGVDVVVAVADVVVAAARGASCACFECIRLRV